MSDDELLALIIGSGSVGYSALDIATNLLRDFRGLNNLKSVSYQDFTKYKGLKKISALKLSAAFSLSNRITKQINNLDDTEVSISSIAKRYEYLSDESQEHLILIVLDRKKRVQYETTIYIGTNNKINCSFRDIYKEILMHDGKYFYLLHNHPNGDKNPSLDDIKLTQELFTNARMIDLHLIDHIIISHNGYSSILCNYKDKR